MDILDSSQAASINLIKIEYPGVKDICPSMTFSGKVKPSISSGISFCAIICSYCLFLLSTGPFLIRNLCCLGYLPPFLNPKRAGYSDEELPLPPCLASSDLLVLYLAGISAVALAASLVPGPLATPPG